VSLNLSSVSTPQIASSLRFPENSLFLPEFLAALLAGLIIILTLAEILLYRRRH
jgi:hypothetical protein